VKLAELSDNSFEWKCDILEGVKTYSDPSYTFSGGQDTQPQDRRPWVQPSYPNGNRPYYMDLSVYCSVETLPYFFPNHYQVFHRCPSCILHCQWSWLLENLNRLITIQSMQWRKHQNKTENTSVCGNAATWPDFVVLSGEIFT